MPLDVDTSDVFGWYKPLAVYSSDGINHYLVHNPDDITFDYFKHYNEIDTIDINKDIINDYHEGHQYLDYSLLDYINLKPVIEKYFSPSDTIVNIIHILEQKYALDYDNICVLFHRGNNKVTETELPNYDEYIPYANSILTKNPRVKFLIQSDETEFIEFMINTYPNNSFYFKDEIRHVNKCGCTVDVIMREKNSEFSKYYLAITILMSKCKYILCGSGNCSIWIMLYRGNCDNVYQHSKNTFLIHDTVPENIISHVESVKKGEYKSKEYDRTLIMNSTQQLTQYIRTNTPCMFVKYGDGEYNAANFFEGGNCDGTPYTPNLGEKMHKSFIYNSQQHNALIGFYHRIQYRLFWENLLPNTEQRSNIQWANFHTIIIDKYTPVCTQSSDKAELYKAIKESSRRKIYIANQDMYTSKELFNIDYHIPIHPNNWFDTEYDSVFNTIKEKIRNDSNTMILTSAGMGAKYLISELHKLYPNAIYLDIGSAFDTICTQRHTRDCYPDYIELMEYLKILV